METLIAGLRVVCDTGKFSYKMDAIVRIVNMGADGSFRFN
jgi:hypothetical protein